MPPPSIATTLIKSTSPSQLVQRKDIDTKTSSQALITKMIASSHFDMQSTGIDAGTGDVTLTLKKTGVTPGTYNTFTVDAYGRILTAWSEANSGGGGSSSSSIQNQYASQQVGSYWISGPARVDGTLQVSTLTVGSSITAASIQLQTPMSTSFGGTGASVASASTFLAGPQYGASPAAPSFRSIAEADVPKIKFDKVYDTPTTLAGYGIQDAYTEVQVDAKFIKNQVATAQPGGLWTANSIRTSDGLMLEAVSTSAVSNKLYNVAGELFWNGSPVISDNSVNAELPLFYSSQLRKIRLQYGAVNFKLATGGVLDTVQDIAPVSSPTFASLNLTSVSSINTMASAFTVASNLAASDPSLNSEFRFSIGDSAKYSAWTPAGSDTALLKRVLELTSYYGNDTAGFQLVRRSIDNTTSTMDLYVDGFLNTWQKPGTLATAGGVKTNGILRLDNAGNVFARTVTIGSPTNAASAGTQLAIGALSIDAWGSIKVETPATDKGSQIAVITPNGSWSFGIRDDGAGSAPVGSWTIATGAGLVRVYGTTNNTWFKTSVSVAQSLELQSYNEQAPSNKLYNLNGSLYWNGAPITVDTSLFEPKWATGTASQYYRGDRTLASLNTDAVPEGSNQYFTQARARASVSASGNASLAYSAITGAFTLSNTPTFNSITIAQTPTADTDAATVAYVRSKVAASPNGRDKFVVADDSQKNYILTNLPISNSSVRVLLNGLESPQGPSDDYTVTGLTVSFTSSVILTTGDTITVLYTY